MGIFDIEGNPEFKRFVITDVNPMSGRKKRRHLSNPNEAMKKLQRALTDALRSVPNDHLRNEYLRYATGAKQGNSPLTNVAPHRRNRYFYVIDFANAFKSVTVEKLADTMMEFVPFSFYSIEEVSEFVEKYLMDPRGGLTLGGNASTDLFNLYVGHYVDTRLSRFLTDSGITYTRYIDDLTFSSLKPITAAVRKQIRQIIIDAGFWINHKKSEVTDLKKGTIVITGIGIEHGGRVFVPRPYLRRVRGFMHRAKTPKELQSLSGMIELVGTISASNDRMNQIEHKVLREYDTFLRSRT